MNSYQQITELNRMPLNQYACILLKKAKQCPGSDSLHLYQLITWGLENNHVEIRDITEPYATADLLEAIGQVELLLSPRKQMDLLTKMGPSDYESWVEPTMLLKMEPAEAAQYLAECLREALKDLIIRVGMD